MGEGATRPIDIYDKANAFSRVLVQTVQSMHRDAVNQSMLTQVIRSGTSIGANLAEADGAPARKDFLHKLSIAIKEGKETLYWLDLSKDAEYMSTDKHDRLFDECEQLVKMLVTIRKKSQESAVKI